MSQDFKLNFDSLPDDDAGDFSGNKASQSDTYDTPGHVRNLCFVWPDGRMKFLNYAYLISGEYLPDENTIKLTFTCETVVITGSMLNGIFSKLLDHLLRELHCSDYRYQKIYEDKPLITRIEIQKEK